MVGGWRIRSVQNERSGSGGRERGEIMTVRGMFESIFGKAAKQGKEASGFFKTLTAYSPVFTTWDGALYENLLVRASIDAFARHASKLSVDVEGTAKQKMRARVRSGPNSWMTWSQYFYRLATILEMQTTAWIIPVLDDELNTVGYFPALPSQVSVMDVDGEAWIKYNFRSGEVGYVEMARCGILTKHQYEDDLFGGGNKPLRPTMELLNVQNQGIVEGIKNGATFRFMARVNNMIDAGDLAKERKRFNENNLQGESGGILLFPVDYSEIRQLEQKPFSLDAEQQKIIETNVFYFFGVNENVLMNKAVGDEWAAFYDGKLEPFAIQASDVMTRMTFSRREIGAGNLITISANRLQYASTKEKLDVSAQMADRGIMNRNEIREIWGLPPIEGGDAFLVRGEYKDPDKGADEIGAGDTAGTEAGNAGTASDVAPAPGTGAGVEPGAV